MFQGQRYRRQQKEAQKQKAERRKRFTVRMTACEKIIRGVRYALSCHLAVGFNYYRLDEIIGLRDHRIDINREESSDMYLGRREDEMQRIPLSQTPWLNIRIDGDWSQPEMRRLMDDLDYITDRQPRFSWDHHAPIQVWEVGRVQNPIVIPLPYDEPPRFIMEDINRWNVVLAPTRFVMRGLVS